MSKSNSLEAIVIGAGPGGLTAALYLARYRRKTLVIHDDTARASRIPLTHNVPGFPDGIAGPDLLARMTEHASHYGAEFERATVTAIKPLSDGFEVALEGGAIRRSRIVILATGLLLNQVDLPHEVHEQAIKDDVLRYCAVCDAYEHIDRAIAVAGCEDSGASQAMFLARYSNDVTLFPQDPDGLADEDRTKLGKMGVKIVERPMESVTPTSESMMLKARGSSEEWEFGVLYPCYGTRPRTELAKAMGLPLEESGNLHSGSHFKTDIPGFFAAGDIVDGLDQISVAMGHGAIAATKAHSWLREQDGHV
jgi:thioredoxin reductase (NADPH)